MQEDPKKIEEKENDEIAKEILKNYNADKFTDKNKVELILDTFKEIGNLESDLVEILHDMIMKEKDD